MQTLYWHKICEIETSSFVVSITCLRCVWQDTRSTKNEYFLEDSIKVMLVICLKLMEIFILDL